MILANSRVSFWATVLAAAVLLSIVFALAINSAAHADPIGAATATTDAGWSLVEQYGLIWGGALLGFGLAGSFLRRNEAAHWIAQGRTLAIATGAVSTLGALLEWRFQGGSPAGVLVTAVMGIKLVLSPTATSSPRTSGAPEGGYVRTWLLVILTGLALGAAGGLAITGCAETKEYAGAGGHAVIDCGKQDLPAIASLLASLAVETAVAGKIDWPKVETLAKGKGLGVGSCALAEFLRAIKKHPEPQVAAAGGVTDVVVQGQAVLARVSGGATVRLADGSVL